MLTARSRRWLEKLFAVFATALCFSLPVSTAAELVAAWNFIIQLEPTNYVELMWASDDANVVLLAASATSVWPAIPSVICTVTQVNNL